MQFDVILVDQTLPDESGIEIVRRLRERRHGIPIVVIAGAPNLQSSFEAGAAGADAYIEGPILALERNLRGPVVGDLGRALRGLRHRPAFAAGIVATVAIAMGPGAAVGTVLETVLLRPLAYPESDQLVSVSTIGPGGSGSRPVTGPEVRAWIEHGTTLQSVSAVESSARASAIVGDPSGQLVTLRAVSHDLFDTLGVAPAVGLTFDAVSHPLTELGVLLSDGAWERYFGRRPTSSGSPFDSRPLQAPGRLSASCLLASTFLPEPTCGCRHGRCTPRGPHPSGCSMSSHACVME